MIGQLKIHLDPRIASIELALSKVSVAVRTLQTSKDLYRTGEIVLTQKNARSKAAIACIRQQLKRISNELGSYEND